MAEVSHVLRADAQENRDRLVAAARGLFAERGLDVPMREVARLAEVGPATLYRHFPTKQALVDEAFARELRTCRQVVEDGCADPDTWRGFRTVIERVGVLNVENHGFVDAFLAAGPRDAAIARHRTELLRMLDGLIGRARASGAAREDLSIADVVLVLRAGRGVTGSTPRNATAAARRFAAIVLDGCRRTPDDPA